MIIAKYYQRTLILTGGKAFECIVRIYTGRPAHTAPTGNTARGHLSAIFPPLVNEPTQLAPFETQGFGQDYRSTECVSVITTHSSVSVKIRIIEWQQIVLGAT